MKIACARNAICLVCNMICISWWYHVVNFESVWWLLIPGHLQPSWWRMLVVAFWDSPNLVMGVGLDQRVFENGSWWFTDERIYTLTNTELDIMIHVHASGKTVHPKHYTHLLLCCGDVGLYPYIPHGLLFWYLGKVFVCITNSFTDIADWNIWIHQGLIL